MEIQRFACAPGMERSLPSSVREKLGITSPEKLHLDTESIVQAAKASASEGWIYLPFCNTMVSESLGAQPVLSLEGARVRDNPYQKAEELPDTIDLSSPRIRAMFEAVRVLSEEGRRVVFQFEGPFTLLSTLLPMSRMFASLRKPAGDALLSRAEDWICAYVDAAAECGIRMLSFADTVATVDILGKKMYTQKYIGCCKSLLRRLRVEHPEIPIHLCGKTSQSMMDTDSCSARIWEPPIPCRTYGDALAAWLDAGDYTELPGQYCLNLTAAPHPYLTLLTL